MWGLGVYWQKKTIMLFSKAPYRVRKLGEFLNGACRGLVAYSLIYRDMPSPRLFCRCVSFIDGGCGGGVISVGVGSGAGN